MPRQYIEIESACMSGDNPPGTASRQNSNSIPQGIIDLTSERAFRPLYHDREANGRWIIRYCLFDDDAAARFRQRTFASPRHETGMHVDAVRPLTAEQLAALERSMRRIEGVSHVRFERVNRPEDAQIHFFTADFDGGCLGRVRNYESGRTQVIVANRLRSGQSGPFEQLAFGAGSVGQGTMLHEILHAMGLSHPRLESGEYANGRSGTVMAYSGNGGPPSEDNDLGRYDIAALQHLYGEPPPGAHPSGLPMSARQPRGAPRCQR
jgi:hypothetical protein